ncbi:MAG: tRNA guanosine(34) transglycosylase Tgt [Micavibrio sp.]|nr:tRNA guanosine(34) transglycosylase Tgt [Micavibrio sp.]
MTNLYPNHSFEILKKAPDSRARLGKIHTPHGVIETPNYIFCGTKGAIRCATPREVKEAGAQIILSNTYHMMLQPGADLVAEMGGLHKFIGWDGPMLTDSGGFQIFAMGEGTVADEIKGRRNEAKPKMLEKITEEGAIFRSYTDGTKQMLSPERAMDVQHKLGADLIMPLDECPPYHLDREYSAKSMEMSHRWELRSLEKFKELNNGTQGLYGIVQGGVYEDLRLQSAEFVSSHPFFGTAIGGSLGVTIDQIYDEVVSWCMHNVPEERPVHLLGIGMIRDIFAGVRYGIDTFDCVIPTRIARHGWALVKGEPRERINLRNAQFKNDPTPLDETQDCYYSQFSRGYLNHLIRANEALAMHILSLHNIATMTRLMREVREAIADNSLDALEMVWRGEVTKIKMAA